MILTVILTPTALESRIAVAKILKNLKLFILQVNKVLLS